MASIDDLVKAANTKRVQVADLADAPKLQATIQSGGQYNVAVQRAGSNKMLDLADALSKVNPMLKDATSVMRMKREGEEDDLRRHKEELARLSSEDLQKRLKQTKDEFDSISRKGGLFDWAMSPVNEQRKRRALGKAAYGQFELAASARLNTPLEGDRDLTTATIVEDEFSKFVEANPALQGQYAGEGFREAVNPLINNLSRQYDTNKARESQKEVGVEAVNSMIRTALDASKDGFDLDMRSAVDDVTDANGVVQESAWNSLNAMSPAVQRATITSVTKSLAKEDPILARRFLNWSKTELKVGNALYGKNEAHVIELEDVVDDMEEQNEKEFEEEREDFVKDQAGGLKIDLTRLNAAKKKDKNSTITVTNAQGEDVEVGTKAELKDIFEDKLLKLQNISSGDRGRILTSFDSILKNDPADGEDLVIDRIFRNAVDSDPRSIRRRYLNDKEKILLGAQVSEETKKDPRLTELAFEYGRILDAKVNSHVGSLLEHDARDAANMLNDFTAEEYVKEQDAFKDALLRRAQEIEEGSETAEVETTVADVKLPEAGEPLPQPESKFGIPFGASSREREITDIFEKSKIWYKAITSGDERSKEARKLIQQYIPELEVAYGAQASGSNDKEDIQRYFEVARFMDGVFTLDVLEDVDASGYGYVKSGVKFNPKLLIGQENAGTFVLMSQEQLDTKDEAGTVDEVNRIIKAIGFKGSRLDFVRAQEALHKKIGSTLVEYEEPETTASAPATPAKRQVGTEKARQDVVEAKAEKEERNAVQAEINTIFEDTAKELNVDSSVFNFNTETMGDSDRLGTLITSKGGVIPFGGIFERIPEDYAGMMTYKQYRGGGNRKKLMYSSPIPIPEFYEKINSDDAADALGLRPEQVVQYRELFNAAEEASKNK